MMIEKTPFEIRFPLKVLTNKVVNFSDENERSNLLKRHIYYYEYGKVRNQILEKRSEVFISLAKKVKKFVEENYPDLDILSVSIFGSSLYSRNPGDFDFLIIVTGNIFSYKRTEFTLIEKGKTWNYKAGVSIKGIENFSRGIFDERSEVPLNIQSQIIYRTAISLFRRHIPVIGYDFIENRNIFLKNIYAQVSDLLNNAYELYYIRNNKSDLNRSDRARKILSRIHEAISYLNLLDQSIKVRDIKKKISRKIKTGCALKESKKEFNKVVALYGNRIKHLNKKHGNKKEVLNVLLNRSLNENIKKRLENYWKYAGLPHNWIRLILEILEKRHYNEDLAIKEVRRRFPQITNKNSVDYSIKLREFRRIKVRNLSRRIDGYIVGKVIVDVGGRSDDLVEQIIFSNKKIERAYVTDLCSFTARSKNPKINFVVQSSPIKIPLNEKTVDTIIACMVFHHLKKNQQAEMAKDLISCLKNRGRIILIEDTYPEKTNSGKYDKITNNFLKFRSRDKKRILRFYDWFGNRLMRNRDNTPLVYAYRTIEEWKGFFELHGMKQIKSVFINENKLNPDLFPPKALMVFRKNN